MTHPLLRSVREAVEVVEQLASPHALRFMDEVSDLLATSFRQGNKVLLAGNGGSLCDACHFAEELTGYFRSPRKALPAIALSDPGHLTCCANDVGFDSVFSRAVEAYGKPGDVFIALTTSGKSSNLIKAVPVAKSLGLKTVVFLGKGGGTLKGMADYELIIQNMTTSDRIQEAHMAAIHLIIECLETKLFAAPAEIKGPASCFQ